MEFSDLIKLKRKEKGLTLKEVSSVLAYSFQAISLYEKGLVEPNIDILNPICKLYKIDINSLMKGEDSFKDDYDQFNEFNIERFITKLKSLRKKNKYSLTALSKKVDISYRSLIRLEKGEMLPSIKDFKNLVKILNTTPKALYYGIENSYQNKENKKLVLQIV